MMANVVGNIFKVSILINLKIYFTMSANSIIFANNMEPFHETRKSNVQAGFSNFVKVLNTTLNDKPTQNITARNEDLCLVACAQAKPVCIGVNFVHNMKSEHVSANCQLFQVEIVTYDLVPNENIHHYSLKNPCLASPCKNDGLCIGNVSVNAYVCKCLFFYSGTNCENAPQVPSILPYVNMSGPFEWSAEIKTTILKATILANAWLPNPLDERPCAIWKQGDVSQGKMFLIEQGRVVLDIGWTGFLRSTVFISDGKWHLVGFRYQDNGYHLTVDSDRFAENFTGSIVPDDPNHQTVLGYDTSFTLCQSSIAPKYEGEIRNLRYNRL